MVLEMQRQIHGQAAGFDYAFRGAERFLKVVRTRRLSSVRTPCVHEEILV